MEVHVSEHHLRAIKARIIACALPALILAAVIVASKP
jgi:hypothetical protein